jgi:hypothetical protein
VTARCVVHHETGEQFHRHRPEGVGPCCETTKGGGTSPDSRSAQKSTASSRWAQVSKLGGPRWWRTTRAAAVASQGLASSQRADMAYTREQVREAVERAGDEHWQALIRHHEDAYPASRPTPGDVCRAEAERLNQLGGAPPTPGISRWSRPASSAPIPRSASFTSSSSGLTRLAC